MWPSETGTRTIAPCDRRHVTMSLATRRHFSRNLAEVEYVHADRLAALLVTDPTTSRASATTARRSPSHAQPKPTVLADALAGHRRPPARVNATIALGRPGRARDCAQLPRTSPERARSKDTERPFPAAAVITIPRTAPASQPGVAHARLPKEQGQGHERRTAPQTCRSPGQGRGSGACHTTHQYRSPMRGRGYRSSACVSAACFGSLPGSSCCPHEGPQLSAKPLSPCWPDRAPQPSSHHWARSSAAGQAPPESAGPWPG
jgi:hypothetical protein